MSIFPESKQEAGPKYWDVLKNMAAKLPDIPSRSEKIEFNQTLNYLVNHFVCDDCVEDAQDFIAANPVKSLKSKEDYSRYICELHNVVNVKTGKPVHDCTNHLGPNDECTTCSRQATTIPDPMIDLKNNIKNVVRKMTSEAGVPEPEVIFQPCPTNESTSCTQIPLLNGDKAEAPYRLYINPYSASFKSAPHEVLHYIKHYKGDPDWNDEIKIDTEARQIVQGVEDKLNTEGNTLDVVEPSVPQLINSATPNLHVYEMDPNSFEGRVAARNAEWRKSFPTFMSQVKHTDNTPITVTTTQPSVPDPPSNLNTPTMIGGGGADQPIRMPEPMIKADEQPTTHFSESFLGALNPVYSPIANVLGVEPKDVNEAHTPAILTNIVDTLAEGNLNHFGALLTDAGSALATLAAGGLMKDGIGFGDRKFLLEMGANFTWSLLRRMGNPKVSSEILEDATILGHGIATGDMSKMHYSVVTFKEDALKAAAEARKKLKRGKRGKRSGQVEELEDYKEAERSMSNRAERPLGGRPRLVPDTYPVRNAGGYNSITEQNAYNPYDVEDQELDMYRESARMSRTQFTPTIA